MITSVFIDVGGPLLDEDDDYLAADRVLLDLLRDDGLDVQPPELGEARAHAIKSYSPSYNSATIWRIVAPDMQRFRRVREALTLSLREMRRAPSIRPNARSVVARLAERYRVVVAGNQPREVRAALRESGILELCHGDILSDDTGVFKPDARFFLAALKLADATANEAVMVGDRLDNDIYPANVLGMKTVRLLTGPFAQQLPRMPRDMPSITIGTLEELPNAVDSLAAPARS